MEIRANKFVTLINYVLGCQTYALSALKIRINNQREVASRISPRISLKIAKYFLSTCLLQMLTLTSIFTNICKWWGSEVKLQRKKSLSGRA